MKQNNTLAVHFYDKKGQLLASEVNLKMVYHKMHSNFTNYESTDYGASANQLVEGKLPIIFDLHKQGLINITKSLTIRDYGCGESTFLLIIAQILARKAKSIARMLAADWDYERIINKLRPTIDAICKLPVCHPRQVMEFGHITAEFFDIGIPMFAKRLPLPADIVFCNDVFEHIPYEDLPAFINDLEASGKYVAANISLRDAVNYLRIDAKDLLEDAQLITEAPYGSRFLEADTDGKSYILSLHATIMSKEKWAKLLGNGWVLQPSQDYTACEATNFVPSSQYMGFKYTLIAKLGFVDFIPWPTKPGSRYEIDETLKRRTANMQAKKLLMELNTLEEFPDSSFKTTELDKLAAWMNFLGVKAVKDADGVWVYEDMPENVIKKLYALELFSKLNLTKDAEYSAVAKKATNIIKNYNDGLKAKVNKFCANCDI